MVSTLHLYASADGSESEAPEEASERECGTSVGGPGTAEPSSSLTSGRPSRSVECDPGYLVSLRCRHVHRLPLVSHAVCGSCRYVREVCLSCGSPCVAWAVKSCVGASHLDLQVSALVEERDKS